MRRLSRRSFLEAGAAVGAWGIAGSLRAAEKSVAPAYASAPAGWQEPQPFEQFLIAGTPRERGRQYGERFGKQIRQFLDEEIVQPFARQGQLKHQMIRYGAQCQERIRDFSPEIYAEMAGMAEGAGMSLDELVVVNLHEELFHMGVLPGVDHCTAVAVSPQESGDGHTYCGQTWDWFYSLYNSAQLCEWRRTEGPSVLAYGYPGLWVGAGINSEGLALCWTSAQDTPGITGPRVGIPAYVLIAQILYQRTLDAAIAEAKRSGQAGWFTFVLADRHGNVANIEGSPRKLAVETYPDHVARNYYGTKEMAGVDEQGRPKYSGRTPRAYELLSQWKGQMNREQMKRLFAAEGICTAMTEPTGRDICTIDGLLFDCTERTAYLTRGPVGARPWTKFTFQ